MHMFVPLRECNAVDVTTRRLASLYVLLDLQRPAERRGGHAVYKRYSSAPVATALASDGQLCYLGTSVSGR